MDAFTLSLVAISSLAAALLGVISLVCLLIRKSGKGQGARPIRRRS